VLYQDSQLLRTWAIQQTHSGSHVPTPELLQAKGAGQRLGRF